jgi:UDP-N-acetylglucosamine 2-epimerase (non-hydrolysing)
MKKKVMVVFGTRPEAIKMAPVVKACKARPELEVKVCVTAQHRQMLDQVMEIFGLTADFDLNVMAPNQTLGDVTCKVLKGMEGVFGQWRPDMILVQGDTTTVMAAALAAFYHKIEVGHVEAGLRTGNVYSPWPEEMNRLIAGCLATQHYAPTPRSRDNLLRENKDPASVFVTGNTVIDALHEAVRIMDADSALAEHLVAQFPFLDPAKRLVLVTGHRRENFGEGFIHICSAIARVAKRDDVQVVYPMHMNPNVRKPVTDILGHLGNVHLIEPLDYLSFLYMMRRSYLIMTDSGGVQEEAPSLGKPVIVMRDTTERPEAVDAGTVILAGTETEAMASAAERLLDDPDFYHRMAHAVNPYGDGLASTRIASILVEGKMSC